MEDDFDWCDELHLHAADGTPIACIRQVGPGPEPFVRIHLGDQAETWEPTENYAQREKRFLDIALQPWVKR